MSTTFRVGERVRVINDRLGSGYDLMTGTVTRIDDGAGQNLDIQVKHDRSGEYGSKFYYNANELEKINV